MFRLSAAAVSNTNVSAAAPTGGPKNAGVVEEIQNACVWHRCTGVPRLKFLGEGFEAYVGRAKTPPRFRARTFREQREIGRGQYIAVNKPVLNFLIY